mmetsp:Transcript_10832/g.16491  ORF Transcript_10832/g.16491 Transcript_10832/m.16491 type:complete len:481 (-) Transcript_10832:62-1504(-)
MMMQYSQVATTEDTHHDHNEDETIQPSTPSGHAIGNYSSAPISKPPSQRRDGLYTFAFGTIFVVMILLSCLIRKTAYSQSLISSKYAGNWASMIMIAPLLASFSGVALYCVTVYPGWVRDSLFSSAIYLSAIVKLCVGSIFIWTDYWVVGVGILLSIVWDSLRFQHAKENLNSTMSLLDLAIEILDYFDSMLPLVCFVVVLVQMFVLLWWGVLFVYLISEVSIAQGVALIIVMMFFLYWIVQFFHSFLGTIVSSAYLWTFVRNNNVVYRRNDCVNQVLLYLRCAISPCLGSVCKAALLVPPSQGVLSTMTVLQWRLRSYGHISAIVSCCAPRVILLIRSTVEPFARSHHRLAHCSIGTYGHTLHKASNTITNKYPDIVDIVALDSTSFLLKMIASWCAIALSAILVAVASIETKGLEPMWPLFFMECFALSYACVSLVLHGFRSAVDAIILAYAENPEEFATRSPILYHRFLRISELDIS